MSNEIESTNIAHTITSGISALQNTATIWEKLALLIDYATTKVHELDNALTELQQTSAMSAVQLEAFYQSANAAAKEMGITTNQIIEQASAWSRLGYHTSTAVEQLSRLSSQLMLISPGLSEEDAISGLHSVMEAYDLEITDVMNGIISKIAAVGSSLSLRNSDILAMLKDTADEMAKGNNTLEETIALETGAFTLMHDSSSADVFKTASLRLRSLNEETQKADDSLKNMKKDIYNLTGVSIMQDNDTYKSTYQILKEISEVWDSLSAKAQTKTLGLVFGDSDSETGTAVFTNFEAIQTAMKEVTNSAGTADAQIAEAADSIDYKLNNLKETGTGILQNLFQRDTIKGSLDVMLSLAEAVLALTENFGLLGTAAAAGLGILSARNFGKHI